MLSFILKSLRNLLDRLFKLNDTIKLIDNKYIYCNSLTDTGKCWIILRCNRCKTKSIPIVSNGKVLPANKYCRYCGSDEYYIEKKQNIERIDTIYALFSKDLIEVKQEMVNYKNLNLHNKFLSTFITQRNNSFGPILENF